MAIGDSYATAAEYRAAIRRTDSADDTQILVDLTATSRHIERVLGLQQVGFNKDASDTTRYQRVDTLIPSSEANMLWLNVPLSAAPTSVTLDTDGDGSWADETALTLTEFSGDVIYHPLGGLLGNTEPITGIELTGNGTVAAAWPAGVMVRIVGKHGWPSVPEPIKSATIGLTEYLRLETARATGQITSIESVVNASAPAQAIIHNLMMTYKQPGSMF
tara:strand:- start:14181 stop:14834 length:654 start_codon:yes stop_codon:yes gene_type:complete